MERGASSSQAHNGGTQWWKDYFAPEQVQCGSVRL